MMYLKMSFDNFLAAYHSSDSRLIRWTQFFLMVFLMTLTLSSASIQRYLGENLRNLLGADMVISRYQPLSGDQAVDLKKLVHNFSKTQMMNITLTHQENWQRVQLKLVDDQYPVQGKVSIGRDLKGIHQQEEHGPEVGAIWLDTRLLTKLNLAIGDYLDVGTARLKVTAVIFHEPDRIMEGHSVAFRAMVHEASFAGQEVGMSKIHFRYLLDANSEQQAAISQWAQERLPDAQLLSRKGGHHPLAAFWQRVENFIGLASVLIFFMAAIALDLASRRQLDRQKYRLALCMSMGMTMRQGIVIALGQWALTVLVSIIPAILVAYAAHFLLIEQLADYFTGLQTGVHVAALLKTTMLILVLLLAFQMPGLLNLRTTSTVSLIQKQEQTYHLGARLIWNFAGLAFLAAIYSDNILLTSMTLGAMLFSILLMAFMTYIFLTAGEKVSRSMQGLLPFTFFMMKQRLLSKSTQILGIGLCATLLLFTLMLMKDFGVMLERQVRSQDGNLLITEADSSHISALEEWRRETGSEIRQLRPFVRAQLIEINQTSLEDFADQPSDSMATLAKPIRLSWSEEIPGNNRLSLGQWWQPQDPNRQQISVEREVMTDTGIKIGDKLTFHIEGQAHDFEVVAGHDFKGGAGSMTFWFQVPPAAIAEIKPEVYYMGSMELPPAAWPKLVELWQAHPTLTLLPLKEMTERYDTSLAMVQKLVLGFSAMIILMALVVMLASVKGFEKDDQKKNGLLLSMGLDKANCVRLALYEWLITALIASSGAIGGTWVAGHLIYQSQFSMTYRPDALWIGVTLVISSILVCVLGLFFCRKSLNVSILKLLAE